MNNFLDIQNVTKVYKGNNNQEVRAVDGVSISINKGEILGLLGVNGAGKTTLSSILATLHPPTSGDVLFKGQSIYDNIMNYRRSLGFCPQHQNLDMFLTVEENLHFHGRYFLMPENYIKERADTLMNQLDITKYKNFDISALSGGNKQKVLIARALMHEPEIVILDEPTVGLDPDIRRKLWSEIIRLKESGITVILTTHYLDEAEILSDRICILDRGKIILVETMKQLKAQYQEENLESIFIKITQEAQSK